MNTITECPLCGNKAFKEVLEAQEYVFLKEKKFKLVRCLTCGLTFLNPQPSEKELQVYYPAELFVDQTDSFRFSSPQLMFLNKAKEAARFSKPGVLLDVGCGPGYFLMQMKERGWQVNGLDISSAACKMAGERVGSENIFQGDLSSIETSSKKYDLITLWHVLEHVPDPKKILKRASSLLKDGGMLIVCCPNFASLLRVFFRQNWFPLVVPHHLFHFTPKTLAAMLKVSGFRVRARKKHFIDPFLNFGSLKLSLLRFFGLGKLTVMVPAAAQLGDVRPPKRSLAWKAGRALFNFFCIIISSILSVLGNEESILIWAEKEKGRDA